MLGNSNKYESINGLRAYAAIGIVLMHVLANICVKPHYAHWIEKTIGYLTNFTFLFMIISAFGMMCGYYEKFKTGIIRPNEFYKKRYIRIWPFFALVVFIDLCLEFNLESAYEAFADLTLCFNLLPLPDIEVIGVGWFIGIVFLFYMIFPFFVFLMDNKSRAWIVCAISLVFCWITINYFSGEKFVIEPIDRRNILYSAPFFISGGIIYLYRDLLSSFVGNNKKIVLTICIILTIVRLCFKLTYLFVIPDLIIFSLWLIYAISSRSIILNNRFVKYLGTISMEVYLCHMMAFRVVDMIHLECLVNNEKLLYPLTCAVVLGGAILFSHIIKFVVFPRIKWIN